MSTHSDVLDCFAAAGPDGGAPLLLLDLTLWHKWHYERGTLPVDWGTSVIEAARALGTAVWAPVRPWRVEYDGVEVTTEETDGQRDVVYRAAGRTMVATWTRGPDGDWWQTEYPVKSPGDLEAAVEVSAARRYVVDTSAVTEWRAAVGQDGVAPVELPMRPYSDVLHTLLGWGEGLTLMAGDGKPLVSKIVENLEGSLARLVSELAGLEGDFLLSPDNLDGQYISPRAFKEFLAPGYAASATAAHGCGKRLVVHVGGPVKRLIPLLAQAGVDGIEGIAGPPQSDATPAEAREAAGPDITIWGGIPQDLLQDEHDDEEFEAGVEQAIQQARSDVTGRTVIGVADRVPVGARIERLHRLVELVR